MSARKKKTTKRRVRFDEKAEARRVLGIACDSIREAKTFEDLRNATAMLAVTIATFLGGPTS